MKLIIDIDEDYYEILKYEVEHGNDYKPFKIIANGTPLDDMTNGDIINTLFYGSDVAFHFTEDCGRSLRVNKFSKSWWYEKYNVERST